MGKHLLLLACAMLCSCAELPNVGITYYDPMAATIVTVTQTVSCDKGQHVVVGTVATQKTAYAADKSRAHEFRIADMDGVFSDTDLTFELSDDGRLKTINSVSEGQAKEIISTALTLATAFVTLAELRNSKAPPKAVPKPPCEIIDSLGKGKDLVIISTAEFPFGEEMTYGYLPFKSNYDGDELEELREQVPELDIGLYVSQPTDEVPAAQYDGNFRSSVRLKLARTVAKTLIVYDRRDAGTPVWLERVIVPKHCGDGESKDCTYDLPIPKAAAFGKEVFSLTLSEAGAITKVRYAKNAGIGGALSAANSAASAVQPETSAEKAKALQAEADLIAQQQRLAKCRATPAECK